MEILAMLKGMTTWFDALDIRAQATDASMHKLTTGLRKAQDALVCSKLEQAVTNEQIVLDLNQVR
jgi:hypothetical protein